MHFAKEKIKLTIPRYFKMYAPERIYKNEISNEQYRKKHKKIIKFEK